MNLYMKNVFFVIIFLIISVQVFSQENVNGNLNDEIIIGNKILTIYNPYKYTDWKGSMRLKGQMHAHSTNSDGSFASDSVARLLATVGYDFWTMPDHNVITPEPASNSLIWMGNSYEHSNTNQHVCVYLADEIGLLDKKINALIKSFAAKGNSILNYAHPWTPLNKSLSSTIKGLTFVEVWNNGTIKSMEWDVLLSKNHKVFALAVDDFHRLEHLKTGWIEVLCQEKTTENIWYNLLKGNYYCVNGIGPHPSHRINAIQLENIDIKDGRLVVKTQNTGLSITFIGKNGVVLLTANDVSEAYYAFDGTESYVRVQIQLGKMILWTQPIFILSKRKNYEF